MKNNYNFIAPYYDFLVHIVFGQSIFHSQLEFLDLLPQKGKLLFIGGGSGKGLEALLKKRPQLKVTYLERSEKMISLSKKRIGNNQNVNFTTAALPNLPDIHFDVVLTFFFFDIFDQTERKQLFYQLDAKLKVDGQWLISDFSIPKKWNHKIIEKLMFDFLKLTTSIASKHIRDYQKRFRLPNYECENRKSFYNHFIFAAVYRKKRNDF